MSRRERIRRLRILGITAVLMLGACFLLGKIVHNWAAVLLGSLLVGMIAGDVSHHLTYRRRQEDT